MVGDGEGRGSVGRVGDVGGLRDEMSDLVT